VGAATGKLDLQAIGSWARYLGVGAATGKLDLQAIGSWARYLTGWGRRRANLIYMLLAAMVLRTNALVGEPSCGIIFTSQAPIWLDAAAGGQP
jgi:hypothetical protein